MQDILSSTIFFSWEAILPQILGKYSESLMQQLKLELLGPATFNRTTHDRMTFRKAALRKMPPRLPLDMVYLLFSSHCLYDILLIIILMVFFTKFHFAQI
jgi:hypothetical protein